MTIRQAILRSTLLSGTWLGLGAADWVEAGPITYSVTVDTSSINGMPGSFDLEFNPGGAGSLAASAEITSFITKDAMLSPPPGTDGAVSGTLQPGPLTIDNTDQVNDLFESLTFGTSISFDVTLSGPALDNPNPSASGSILALLLADNNGNALLTTDQTYGGAVAVVTVNTDGSTTGITPPAPDGSTAATVTPQQSSVPEPSSLVLFVFAASAGLVYWRRSS